MKKLSVLILAGLLLPAFVFGAVEYSRTPSGYTIENPVSFEVSIDNYDEFLIQCDNELYRDYWALEIVNSDYSIAVFTDYVASSTLSYTFIENLPLTDDYIYVWLFCATKEDDEYIGRWYAPDCLECEDWENGEIIFEVVGEEPTGFLTITPTFITGTLAYIQGLFSGSGVWPLVVLAIGMPLGFWASAKFIDLVKLEEKPRRKPQKWFPPIKLTREEKKENWLG